MKRGDDEVARVTSLGIDADDVVTEALEIAGTYTKMVKKVPEYFEPKEWPFVSFAASTSKARAGSELRALTSIQVAGQKDWRAQAWFLEHTRMERYSHKTQISLEGPTPGSPIEVKQTVTVDQLEEKLNKLLGNSEE